MSTLDAELAGAEVASVEFVRDYLQLHLEKEIAEHTPFGNRSRSIHVNMYTSPEIVIGGTRLAHGQPGWRDALVGLIDDRLATATERENVELSIGFEGGGRLVVSLLPDAYTGPEAVVVIGLATWAF
jgi:hypothetical protein